MAAILLRRQCIKEPQRLQAQWWPSFGAYIPFEVNIWGALVTWKASFNINFLQVLKNVAMKMW